MSKSRFRIIALRPILPHGCDDITLARVRSIQKKVFGAEWLYFYGGYKLTDDIGNFDENSDTPFYGKRLDIPKDSEIDGLLYDTDDLAVSISAVVGPNGSGKSSAVELMIRILNNLSVAAKGETFNHKSSEHLFFIEDVYGCIVAVEGDMYIQIQVLGRSVRIASYNRDDDKGCYICGPMSELLNAESKENRFKPITGNELGMQKLYKFFYTAIFNYSMYAYNYNDYYEERTIEDRWNRKKKTSEEMSFFSGVYTQEQNWLMGLFHKNDGYQTPIVLNPMRDNGNINVPKENKLTAERLNNLLFYSNDNKEGHGGQPLFPFRIINDHLEIVAIKISKKENCYFDRQNLFKTLKFKGNSLTRNFEKVRACLCEIWCNLFCMTYHELTEHERIAWDYVVYKTLKIAKTYDKYDRLEKALFYFKIFNPKTIEPLLMEMLKDETHITLKLRQALCFLKFPIFKEDYREIIPLRDVYNKYSEIIHVIKDMVFNINHENGHLIVEMKGSPILKVDPNTGHLELILSNNNKQILPWFYIENGELFGKTPDNMEVMLPPIFDTTLLLIEREKIKKDGTYDEKDLIPMYGLSSGERQISGVISNFVYHLVNIDSVWKDQHTYRIESFETENDFNNDVINNSAPIKYKYINAVFDEVELYFHPDLQRRFVNYLMSALGNLNLDNIEGLNILMVTHSPFVLSDLPRNNVLALGDKNEIKETFCANIHEMLGSSFFMKYTFGDLAREQIEEIFDLYIHFQNNNDKKNFVNKYKTNWPRYKYVASLIADGYLHKVASRMLKEMSEYLPEESLSNEELDKRIQEAERRLRDLKARKSLLL